MNYLSRKLRAVLLILALSNLANGPTVVDGMKAEAKAPCCMQLKTSVVIEALAFAQEIIDLPPKERIAVSVIVLHYFVFFYLSSTNIFEQGRAPAALSALREGTLSASQTADTTRLWQIGEPGFISNAVVSEMELETKSESEFSLTLVGADEMPGFNIKEYVVGVAEFSPDAPPEAYPSSIVKLHSYIQVRGFGRHLRVSPEAFQPVASSSSTGSLVVSVFGPGRDGSVDPEDWVISTTILPGYEQFLDGPLEIVQDVPGPASAEIRLRGNSSRIPGGQDFQRVPLLFTATSPSEQSISKRVDIFVEGDRPPL